MFNFLNVSDAKGLWPIVILAGIGILGWYLWNRSKQNASDAIANSTASVSAPNGATLAALSALIGGNTGPHLSASQPTYTGSNAQAAPAPSTSGSSTGNSYVTQGL